MTAAHSPTELTKAPPEGARIAVYPMRTQRSPVRVVYAVAPDAFAVAALTDGIAGTVHDGAGLAILPVELQAGAALTHGAPVLSISPILALE